MLGNTLNMYFMAVIYTILYHANIKKIVLLTMRLDPILVHVWNMLFGNILRTIGLLSETLKFWSPFWSPDIIIRSMWLILWGYPKSIVYPDSIRYFPEFKYAVERHTSNILDIPTTVNSAAVLICNLVVENGGRHIEHVLHGSYLYNSL